MSTPYKDSLVKYEAPNPNPDSSEIQKIRQMAQKKKRNLPPIESKPDYQSILNAILPPREWEHDGKHYVQYVSHNGASREDVNSL